MCNDFAGATNYSCLARRRSQKSVGSCLSSAKLVQMRTIVCWFICLVSLPALNAAPIIESKTAKVGDLELHYLTAGHGPTILLLHGFAETSRMWRPLMPSLAEKFTVIAPDLPGIGDSSIPADKIDMPTAATRIHDLLVSLGVKNARVAGHDIGLMVAYAYATQFPSETEKLAVMDAFLPRRGGMGTDLQFA